MKKKVLLTGILSIVMCLSLIAGATFALFTSESKVNIAVTSGNVEVVASIDQLKTYSLDEEQVAGTFENGGTATLTADQGLSLDNITPGDKATFNIKVENKGNVVTSYRVRMYTDGDLASELIAVATIDGTDYELTSVDSLTPWNVLPVAGMTINMSVELPKEVGNAYQEKNAMIYVVVEAMQGNAAGKIFANGVAYENWDQAIAAAGANGTLEVAGTVVLPNTSLLSGMTIEGLDYATVSFTSSLVGNITFKNVTVTGTVYFNQHSGETATFENCTFLGAFGNINQSVAANIVTRNCTFKGRFHIDSPLSGSQITVDSCEFAETALLKIGAGATVSVIDTEFAQVPDSASIWGVKGIISYAPISFEGCEFNNRLVLAGSNGMAIGFTNCTMNGGAPVIFNGGADDIIGGGNVPNVTIDGVAWSGTTNQTGLAEAIATGETNILIGKAGDYSITVSEIPSGATIVGVDGTVIDMVGNLQGTFTIKNATLDPTSLSVKEGDVVTFENCVFTQVVGMTAQGVVKGDMTFVDCVFEKGVHVDTSLSTSKITFLGCTFDEYGYVKLGGSAIYTVTDCVVEKLASDATGPWGKQWFIVYSNATFVDCQLGRVIRAGATIDIVLDGCVDANGDAVTADIVHTYNTPNVTIK